MRCVCRFIFERIYIPDSFDGTPESAYQEALQKKQAYDEEEQKLKKQLHDTLEKHAGKITGACAALEHYCNNFDVRKFAVCTTPGRKPGEQTEYYILYGWMSADDARKLEKRDGGRFKDPCDGGGCGGAYVRQSADKIKESCAV